MKTIMQRYQTVLRCYDNNGRTFDRYTIIPPRWDKLYIERRGLFAAIGASENPYAPQGFGMHVSAVPGAHLGKRVSWDKLPPNVQDFARQAFPEYAPIRA
jgi:hypothetical protein